MFNEHQQILDEAKACEQKIKKEHDKKIEEKAQELKKRVSDEFKNMEKNIFVKNYNPMEYYNEMIKLKQSYDELVKQKESEIEALEKEVDSKLSYLIKYPMTDQVKANRPTPE